MDSCFCTLSIRMLREKTRYSFSFVVCGFSTMRRMTDEGASPVKDDYYPYVLIESTDNSCLQHISQPFYSELVLDNNA